MKNLLYRIVCVAACCLATGAQATLLTFDPPLEVIEVDDVTSIATYKEGGFRITGDAASYLPLFGIGTGGSDGLLVFANNPITLTAAGGGVFNLLGLEYAVIDAGFGLAPNATLMVSGVLTGGGSLHQILSLDDLGFDVSTFPVWINLTQVSFAANADFVLDNISAAPQPIAEPSSLALVGAALAGLALARRGRRAGQRHPWMQRKRV